ncbi:MAG: hypothetical protein GYA55_11980 [SAR324 cluster bacterium]|uniref:Leucine-binding protein domain-containing protein n=1 Tax=SAR324 cluster bacterium TaxID=2024889 RepID=A0A7X9FT69_9DELT|nr:hypothetical protein [SAR324 cluster bacterium]
MILKTQRVFFAVLLLVPCIVRSGLSEALQEIIIIGIIIPSTGAATKAGDIVKNGAELAIKNFKSFDVASDKTCSSFGKRFKLLIEDTASETKNAVAAFNKLYANDGYAFS